MTPWAVAGALVWALLSGFGMGWWTGRRLSLRMPNAYTTTLLLLAGSLGGPLLTSRLLGGGLLSFVLALLIAGFAAGLAFWPMGERQGERQWL